MLNVTLATWLNLSAPLDEQGRFDRCRIFNVSYDDLQERPDENSQTIACNTWEFSHEQFQVLMI